MDLIDWSLKTLTWTGVQISWDTGLDLDMWKLVQHESGKVSEFDMNELTYAHMHMQCEVMYHACSVSSAREAQHTM